MNVNRDFSKCEIGRILVIAQMLKSRNDTTVITCDIGLIKERGESPSYLSYHHVTKQVLRRSAWAWTRIPEKFNTDA